MEYERFPEYRVEKVETHTSLARVVNEARDDGYVVDHTIVVGSGEVWVLFEFSPTTPKGRLNAVYWALDDALAECNDEQPDPMIVQDCRESLNRAFEDWFNEER